MPRWRRISIRWVLAGVAVGLLVSFLTLLVSLCPPVAELPFGVTILGVILGGTAAYMFGSDHQRTGSLLVGMALGFAAAFVLIFGVFVESIPEC